MISSWIFDVIIIKKAISAVSITISRRCVQHPAFSSALFVNIYSQSRFSLHISVHYATKLHCTVLSEQNRPLLTMLRCYGLLSRHLLVLQYYNWLLRSFVPIITAVPTRYTFCTSFLNHYSIPSSFFAFLSQQFFHKYFFCYLFLLSLLYNITYLFVVKKTITSIHLSSQPPSRSSKES